MSSLSDARKLRDAEIKAAIEQYGMGSPEYLAVVRKWATFEALPSLGFTVAYIAKALDAQYNPGGQSFGLGGVIDRCVQQAGRSTIQSNARRDPAKVRWARMPSEKCCSFCLMLASKGAVFFSEASAGGNGDGTNWYHENCRCQPVPVWEGQKPPYDADALYDMYLKSVENAGPGATTEQILEQIRKDWPDMVTDGIQQPNKPVAKTQTGGIDGKWSDDEKARRQAALGFDMGKDSLTQEEIEFYEKFKAAGQKAEYIKRVGSLPSNDFHWVNFGSLEFEQKTSKDRYETIHGAILKASSRAAKQGIVKDNFIIDIRDAELTDELRHDLAGYNEGREKYRLQELWVMSKGEIYRINLRA